ncbi:MAG: hypothetical protein ACSW8A_00455, partial [Lachnospiraceae bacterium]
RRIERFRGRRTSLISVPGASFYLADLADALYQIPEIIDFDVYESRRNKLRNPESKACEPGQSSLKIVGRTLPGESISPDMIKDSLFRLVPGLQRASLSDLAQDLKAPLEHCEDDAKEDLFDLQIYVEETTSFPSGYNMKKKVRRLDDH